MAQKQPQTFPPQHQNRHPGVEAEMQPKPIDDDPEYRTAGKLEGKVALITGGDSGIGRATAILYAKERADVAIVYLNEDEDAAETKRKVENYGRRCLTIRGDVGNQHFCEEAVRKTIREFGHLEILVNNAAQQFVTEGIESISAEQLEHTVRTNLFGYFFMAKAAIPHLKEGASIINTASIQAARPKPSIADYAVTKGAGITFTKALAQELTPKGIRVNAVAPGPVWTPLIPSSFSEEHVEKFGSGSPMKRAAQPAEIAPAYVYLASRDSSFVSGETIFQTGGTIV